ncbi:MAG: right-handed parallel beta-helix repeat-containing protein, partial [Candidatus Hodarchaeota archaeon]
MKIENRTVLITLIEISIIGLAFLILYADFGNSLDDSRILPATLLPLSNSTESYKCAPPLKGNWIIDRTCVIENEYIVLKGNLTVLNGGTLVVKNDTLIICGNFDGEYGITIKGGGALFIDSSIIKNEKACAGNNIECVTFKTKRHCESNPGCYWKKDHCEEEALPCKNISDKFQCENLSGCSWRGIKYFFTAESGAKVEITDSYISGAGWNNVEGQKGLEFYNPNTKIIGNLFEYNYIGASFYADSNIIRNNILRNIKKIGLHFNCSDNNDVSYNELRDVNFEGWDREGIQTQAIAFHNSNHNKIINNIISSSTASPHYGKMVGSGIKLLNSNNNHLENNKLKNIHVWAIELRNSCNNVIENNSVHGVNGDGILIFGGSNHNSVTNFTVRECEFGVFVGGIGNKIKNVYVDQAVRMKGGGIRLTSGSGNQLENITVVNSKVGMFISGRNGVMSENNSITDINLYGNLIGLSFDDPHTWRRTVGSRNNIIRDVQIFSCEYDVYSTQNNVVNQTLTNVTFQSSRIDRGSIHVKWYLDVQVVDGNNAPIIADITITDVEDNLVFSGSSYQNGRIERQELTEYVQNSTGRHYVNDYTIYATNGTYYDMKFLNLNDNMVDNKKVTLTLAEDHAPVLCPLEDIVAFSGDLVSLTVNAYDIDGDDITYYIDDTRFSQYDGTFIWQTDSHDQGSHSVLIIVSDGKLS